MKRDTFILISVYFIKLGYTEQFIFTDLYNVHPIGFTSAFVFYIEHYILTWRKIAR